jgi:hypothetical protein
MSINIEVNGTLYPTTSGVSAEPTHNADYGLGGYRTVADSGARDDIPDAYLQDGMLVYLESNELVYQYDAVGIGSWNLFTTSVGVDAVDTPQIVDGAVTTAKLDNGSVDDNKLGSGAVVLGKVASASIQFGALVSDSVEYANLRADVTNAFMPSFVGTPSANNDAGVNGAMAYDYDHLYICLIGAELPATSGNWGRIAITSGWV